MREAYSAALIAAELRSLASVAGTEGPELVRESLAATVWLGAATAGAGGSGVVFKKGSLRTWVAPGPSSTVTGSPKATAGMVRAKASASAAL